MNEKNGKIILIEFEYDRYGNNYLKKPNVIWSPEMIHDLQAFHRIDAEAELTALLSEEIAQEIDRQIIQDIFRL